MTGFSRIEIDGFRRLRGIDLKMRPLCALIGANGSGKASFLEAFSLLAASAQGRLASRVSDSGGIQALATMGGPLEIRFGLHAECRQPSRMPDGPLNPIEYQLKLHATGDGGYFIAAECLSESRSKDGPPFKHIDSGLRNVKYSADEGDPITPTWQHDHSETSLYQVPKTFIEPEGFREGLASSTFYHALNVDRGARVRLPQPMQPASLPGKDGEHLTSCLYSLRETNRDRFEAIENALHA